jgi:hypothetical protein
LNRLPEYPRSQIDIVTTDDDCLSQLRAL